MLTFSLYLKQASQKDINQQQNINWHGPIATDQRTKLAILTNKPLWPEMVLDQRTKLEILTTKPLWPKMVLETAISCHMYSVLNAKKFRESHQIAVKLKERLSQCVYC